MFVPPIFQKLQASSKNILLAGMGGGYDVFSAIPLYFELNNLKDASGNRVFGEIILANLSFTEKLTMKDLGKRITDVCLEVRFSDYVSAGREGEYTSTLGYPQNYFAEWHLSKWFHEKHQKDVPVYAFSLYDLGVARLTEAYQKLCELYNIDTIILIDAGVDSLLKGDEQGLGTFAEDLISTMAAKNTKTVQHKYLMCIGLSTEGGISEYDFLENWASVQKEGGFLGAVSWQIQMDSVKQYIDALSNSVPTNSTINAQIVAGVESHYGLYLPEYLRTRPGMSAMFVNPLMAMSWYFDLQVVINHRKYLQHFEDVTSLTHTHSKMEVVRLNDKVVNIDGIYIGKRKYKNWF